MDSSTYFISATAGRWWSTTRRTHSARRRRTRSSSRTTGCSGSSTRLRASGPAPRRWRSSTTSSSGRTGRCKQSSRAATCPSSRPSCPPRSRGSRPASSRRLRATSPAPAAPHSISSARARGCARGSRRPLPRSYLREARKRVGPKKERIGPIIERLAAEHADAAIALRFRSPLELLVSVMLSAQTTDVNVNRVTETLFEKYRKPEDYLAVPQEELERDIFATGFYRQKAKALRGTMRTLLEEFDGEVPSRLEELIRLPGVARKTGNVVAAELGEPQGIVVDTHVSRFPHLLIWHGRRVCDARRPRCEDCAVNDLCPASRL